MRRFRPLLPLSAAIALLVLPSPASANLTGSTLLVSRPDGTGPVQAPIDNDSAAPLAVSADGRYVAFLSAADGFAPGANPSVTNLFVRDTVTDTTTLASRSDGLAGAGVNADVAGDELAQIGIVVQPATQALGAPQDRPHVIVVFSTKATNLVDHASRAVPATGGREAVWMRDVTAGTTYLVSRASGLTGAPADGPSLQPSIAAGPRGPLVAFSSESTNLDRAGPTSPSRSVYLRETAEGFTHPVSCLPDRCSVPSGSSSEPSLQVVATGAEVGLCPRGAQCALVAFKTADPEVAGAGAGTASTQIAVASSIEKADGSGLGEFDGFHVASSVSLRPGTPGNGFSAGPELSPDGLGVAFFSDSTNLDPFGPPLPPNPIEAYVHAFASNATGLASVGKGVAGNSLAANAPVTAVSIAGPIQSWRFGFHSVSTNLGVPTNLDGLNRAYQVRPVAEAPTLLDRAGGANGAIGNGESAHVELSADGSTAAFLSDSSNLNAGGGSDFGRVYVRRIDPAAPNFNSLELVSRPSGTGVFSVDSKRASITTSAVSADGRYVAFQSDADDLSSLDDNRFTNVFVRDTGNGTTTLVSRANGAEGAAANSSSQLNGISDDGQRILFTTAAENLGPGQRDQHAYVRDVAAQTTTIVTRANGPTGTIAPGLGRDISGNGNRVAFTSGRPLDPEADNGFGHLYVRDLAAQTTTFADRANGVTGLAAGTHAEEAVLNHDGNRVAWTTRAFIRVPGAEPTDRQRVYVRDLGTGTTVLASRADGTGGAESNADSFHPAINAAGDVVAFESAATNLGATSQFNLVWVRRLGTGRTELVSRADGAAGAPADIMSHSPSIDASGTRIAFASVASNLGPVPIGAGASHHAYVRDTSANTTELVDRVNGVGGAPAEPTNIVGVSISASGDCVAFAGTGANFTDDLASADFTIVRERVLRGSCGIPAGSIASLGPVRLTRLRIRPKRFHVGRRGGAKISFKLSAASRVSLGFDRMVRKRSGAKRVPRRAGRLNLRGRAGANRLHFSGRLRRRALRPGRYRLTARPLRGTPVTRPFVVLRRPAR